MLCPSERCRGADPAGRAQAGRRQGTGSRSLGHEQRLSNTASRLGSP